MAQDPDIEKRDGLWSEQKGIGAGLGKASFGVTILSASNVRSHAAGVTPTFIISFRDRQVAVMNRQIW